MLLICSKKTECPSISGTLQNLIQRKNWYTFKIYGSSIFSSTLFDKKQRWVLLHKLPHKILNSRYADKW